jgi:hypothetical protein
MMRVEKVKAPQKNMNLDGTLIRIKTSNDIKIKLTSLGIN